MIVQLCTIWHQPDRRAALQDGVALVELLPRQHEPGQYRGTASMLSMSSVSILYCENRRIGSDSGSGWRVRTRRRYQRQWQGHDDRALELGLRQPAARRMPRQHAMELLPTVHVGAPTVKQCVCVHYILLHVVLQNHL